MRSYESADLADLERAIRSLAPVRAPAGLRTALRHELLAAAGARPVGGPLAALLRSTLRTAFAVTAAFFLLVSGWTIAASAPGDLAYPIKEVVARLISAPERHQRVPIDGDVIEMPIDGDVIEMPIDRDVIEMPLDMRAPTTPRPARTASTIPPCGSSPSRRSSRTCRSSPARRSLLTCRSLPTRHSPPRSQARRSARRSP